MTSPDPRLRRRQLLRLGLGAGALLALPSGLAGCRSAASSPSLLSVEGELPAAWLRELPAGWRSRTLANPATLLAELPSTTAPAPAPAADTVPVPPAGAGGAALVALGDGWATSTPQPPWQPLEAEALLARLAAWAAPASRLFAPDGAPALAYPWAFSPWVIALRSRPALAARAAEGWDLLLDPSLRGKLVLPSSPRLCMELMGLDFARIQALRRQALAHDDRDGLSLLLSGEAEAAVLPLRRLIPLLRRDQRLAVVLPASGAPLRWQLLLRPLAAREPLPLAWLAAVLEEPLLLALLQAGWVPPLPRPQLEPLLARFPAPVAALLLPPEAVVQRCWSLPPLGPAERLALQTVWDAAAPAAGA